MLKEKMTLLKAMALLSTKYPKSFPNPYFMSQLSDVETKGLPPKVSFIDNSVHQCRKCRQTLFSTSDLTTHTSKQKHKV